MTVRGPIRACSLCGSDTRTLCDSAGKRYARCLRCDLISLDRAFRPSAAEERQRYLLHHNSEHDGGYVRFLSEFIDAAVEPAAAQVRARLQLRQRAAGGSAVGGSHPAALRLLDYGSGPNPVLASILRARGFDVTLYDRCFAPDRSPLGGRYDIIILHEVAEHVAPAAALFRRLARLLPAGGELSVRTRLHPACDDRFLSWWYRSDATHVTFFGAATFEWIGSGDLFSLEWSNGTDMVRLTRR
ncbi:class I SAM-dependent methyltransferase [Salinispira pacifica]